ncbi:DUF2637 domain-containing protein [Streptomyces sp. NPDC059928]|uniref:DUF2637 domain-containing protein n=1 Tax=unclassified Streptomyces TaxID=2593676 RepID=UPI00365739D5
MPLLTNAIRLGVALVGLIGFALSYDALRQMAVAAHIAEVLTYAFPLVIDGFIAIGVAALLILRAAPWRSRLYVWALVGTATVTSIWANALHAVRLNQASRPTGLHLDDLTVGALSAIAPLALAGAVHLDLVIRRQLAAPQPPEGEATAPPIVDSPSLGVASSPEAPVAVSAADDPTPEHARPQEAASGSDGEPMGHPDPDEPSGPSARPAPESSDGVPAQATPAPRRTGRPPNASLDELLAIARPVVERTGEIDRDAITEEIRDVQGRKAANGRLLKVFKILEAEHATSRPASEPSA